MNRILFTVLFTAIFVISSCGEANKGSAVEVTVEGGGGFPAELAGRWKADTDGWELQINDKGVIEEIVWNIIKKKLIANMTAKMTMSSDNSTGIVEPGEWTIKCDPISRELNIKIEIARFSINRGDVEVIECNTIDFFDGVVSEDNMEFITQWTSYPKYYSSAKGERMELPLPSEPARGQVVFRKVGESQQVN